MIHRELLNKVVSDSKNKHIIIFSNYRTGSTVLGLILQKLTNIQFYPEAFLDSDAELRSKMWKSINNGEQVLVSIQGDQFTANTNYFLNHDSVLNNCYSIKLYRKSFLDQFTSFYIATKTEKFSYAEQDSRNEFEVEIDYLMLGKCFDRLTETNKILNDLNYPFDLELTYEDHINAIGAELDTSFLKTPVPKNYTELQNAISIFLDEMRRKDTVFLQ